MGAAVQVLAVVRYAERLPTGRKKDVGTFEQFRTLTAGVAGRFLLSGSLTCTWLHTHCISCAQALVITSLAIPLSLWMVHSPPSLTFFCLVFLDCPSTMYPYSTDLLVFCSASVGPCLQAVWTMCTVIATWCALCPLRTMRRMRREPPPWVEPSPSSYSSAHAL